MAEGGRKEDTTWLSNRLLYNTVKARSIHGADGWSATVFFNWLGRRPSVLFQMDVHGALTIRCGTSGGEEDIVGGIR